MSPEKSYNGKNFEIKFFILNYVLEYFESIPTKFKANCHCHFLTYDPPFLEDETPTSPERSNNGKKFRNRDIRFEISFAQF